MKAVILAAGKGTRMRELTNELPKPARFLSFRKALNISSRGLDKEFAVREILKILAAQRLGIKQIRGGFTKKDLASLEKAIGSYVKEIVPLLSKKKIWLDT